MSGVLFLFIAWLNIITMVLVRTVILRHLLLTKATLFVAADDNILSYYVFRSI